MEFTCNMHVLCCAVLRMCCVDVLYSAVHCACYAPGGGGRLQLVLMRHPPSYLSKLVGGGGVGAGGGSAGGRGYWQLGRGGGAARNPLLSHAYLKGVSAGMGV